MPKIISEPARDLCCLDLLFGCCRCCCIWPRLFSLRLLFITNKNIHKHTKHPQSISFSLGSLSGFFSASLFRTPNDCKYGRKRFFSHTALKVLTEVRTGKNLVLHFSSWRSCHHHHSLPPPSSQPLFSILLSQLPFATPQLYFFLANGFGFIISTNSKQMRKNWNIHFMKRKILWNAKIECN